MTDIKLGTTEVWLLRKVRLSCAARNTSEEVAEEKTGFCDHATRKQKLKTVTETLKGKRRRERNGKEKNWED